MARRSESSGSPSPPAEPLPLTMPHAAQATSLQLRRRFVFRGNAAAFGGRFVRPDDVFLETPGASSLPVVGGRSVAAFRGPAENFKGYLSFDSATTFAEGKFNDLKKAIALTRGKVKEETLVTSTRVRAEIKGLVVGTEKRLTVGRMVAELRSTSPSRVGLEPTIPVGEVAIEGLSVDGFRLRVIFDPSPFNEHDTHAKILRSAGRATFVKQYGQQLLTGPRSDPEEPQADPRDARHQDPVGGRQEPARRRRRQSHGGRQGLRQDFLRRDPDQRRLPASDADATRARLRRRRPGGRARHRHQWRLLALRDGVPRQWRSCCCSSHRRAALRRPMRRHRRRTTGTATGCARRSSGSRRPEPLGREHPWRLGRRAPTSPAQSGDPPCTTRCRRLGSPGRRTNSRPAKVRGRARAAAVCPRPHRRGSRTASRGARNVGRHPRLRSGGGGLSRCGGAGWPGTSSAWSPR